MTTTRSHEQLLTFFVAGAEYGVDILRVQEIRGWQLPVPLPGTPPFVKGVINIRGDIVPIADLRERLGLAPAVPGATTAIVVLRIEHEARTTTRGIVVDAMSDVTNVDAARGRRGRRVCRVRAGNRDRGRQADHDPRRRPRVPGGPTAA